MKILRALEDRAGVGVDFDLLTTIRVRQHELAAVAVGVTPDLVAKSGLVLLEEPQHGTPEYRQNRAVL